MQNAYEEFAINWVPRQGSLLAEFGFGWTGWCAERGMRCDLETYRRMRSGYAEAPGTTALTGLHAPLKTPFRLAHEQSFWALDHDLMSLAETFSALLVPQLELSVLDGRVVVVSSRPTRLIRQLIRQVEHTVHRFEADPEHANGTVDHRIGGIDLPGMAAWTRCASVAGAQFHLPLTDRMALDCAFDLVDAISPKMRELLARGATIGDLALLGNPGRGRPWCLIERYVLSDAPQRRLSPQPKGMAYNGPDLTAPSHTGLAFV